MVLLYMLSAALRRSNLLSTELKICVLKVRWSPHLESIYSSIKSLLSRLFESCSNPKPSFECGQSQDAQHHLQVGEAYLSRCTVTSLQQC